MKTKTAFMSYNKGLETWSFWKTKEDAKIGKKDDEFNKGLLNLYFDSMYDLKLPKTKIIEVTFKEEK